MDEDKAKNLHRRRGIYLLPNLFTTAGLFAGFYAIVAAMNHNYENAAIAIFVAMIMDGIDGRVARLTNTTSEFGVQYDSLSDMVCFGLAPSLVLFQWALGSMIERGWVWSKLGWLAAFVYTAGAALRLARFNTQAASADKRYFQGFPSPSAAGVLAGLVWLSVDNGLDGSDMWAVSAVLTALMGVLMVSNIRYYSFKGFDLKRRVPFVTLLLVVLAFVVVSSHPPGVLFFGFLAYAISGPVITLYQKRKRLRRRLEK
ncbi:CDP-diacylglycerol--serine O-phosphatidyltransferase [hydrothermal vent metagenome]|uniref:CDP-diacylglycerol--serine O-phosphatidyltransferase n=1 Tax=hydrothermal vent metagenome TaxID=652676 RepID=A0A3B0YSY8_9ZZZZ